MKKQDKPTKRVAFIDFWGDFKIDDQNMYIAILKSMYRLILDYDNPEVVFHSTFGSMHKLYPNAIKICICGENCYPDFNVSDFAISTLRCATTFRNFYSPAGLRINAARFFLDTTTHSPNDITNSQIISSEPCSRKFCSFIYSQDSLGEGAKIRKTFCQRLMNYKNVDCPGAILKNMSSTLISSRHTSDWHTSKLKFLNQYKFNIAFENSQGDGYITEKLIDCYMANVVPIYWGSFGNIHPFPPESMILVNSYSSFNHAIEAIKAIDNDDEAYMRMLNANPISPAFIKQHIDEMRTFLHNAIEHEEAPFDKWNIPSLGDFYTSLTYPESASKLSIEKIKENRLNRQIYSRMEELIIYVKKSCANTVGFHISKSFMKILSKIVSVFSKSKT